MIASPPQACLSTAIQKARDRQRVGTGADLDCSRSYIGKLEVEGVILRQGDGFPLDQSRVAYLRYLRREHRQPRAEADADHVKVKTDVADQDHGEAAQALVRRDAVDKLIDAMCGTVLTHLSGMSARCSRDMVVRRNIDAVVHQIRREMAAACLAKADQSSSVTDCGICRKRSRCRANETTRKSKVRSRPWGHWGVSGRTVQMPPTRDGDPISLTAACDTFVTTDLARQKAAPSVVRRQAVDQAGAHGER